MRSVPRATDATRTVDPAKAGTLEVSWWMLPPAPSSSAVVDASPRIDLVLGKFQSNETGLPEEQVRTWRENGLRVFAVPTGELDAIRKALGASGPVEQQLLAQSGTWKAAYKGPAWTGFASLRLDSGPLELPAGALRAMVRSWLVPVSPESGKVAAGVESAADDAKGNGDSQLASAPRAGMQLELALQHLETRKPVSEFQAALAIERPKTLSDEGLVFWRLQLSGTLKAGWSYLVVPVEPSVEWKVGPLDRLVEKGAAKSGEGPGGVPASIAGPALPAPPTLGEALLSDAMRGRADRRSILVLTPNVPDRFELMPSGLGP